MDEVQAGLWSWHMETKLAVVTAHAGADSLREATESWCGEELKWEPVDKYALAMSFTSTPPVIIVNGQSGMLQSYQYGFQYCPFNILAFLHDDTIIHDKDWVNRVLYEFEDPTVGLVGFGGAIRHGSPELYKVPYDYHQLGRSHFISNMTDWQNHGTHFTEARDVAVLDGFALIVRRSILENCRIRIEKQFDTYNGEQYVESHVQIGWPLGTPIGYVAYDYWLCCMCRRLGYRIRLLGISCSHLGGRTFVKLGIGKDPKHWQQYLDAHRFIFDEFKDVLPYEVPR